MTHYIVCWNGSCIPIVGFSTHTAAREFVESLAAPLNYNIVVVRIIS